MSQFTQTMSGEELERLINKALTKVGGAKENDLCRYIPAERGGYLHHFTLRKMKSEDPVKLGELIGQHIIATERPVTVAPKQRMPRGTKKRKDQLILNRDLAEKLVQIARDAGHPEIASQLSPPRSLGQLRRELLSTVKAGRVDQHLWNQWCEALQQSQSAR
ncbi:MAG: hypothetical protein ACOYKZ_04760 [Chlamydiia bacterium]